MKKSTSSAAKKREKIANPYLSPIDRSSLAEMVNTCKNRATMNRWRTCKYMQMNCNTPVLTLFALNVYDVYNVIDHGVELKAKDPPSIWLCHVSAIEIIADGIL